VAIEFVRSGRDAGGVDGVYTDGEDVLFGVYGATSEAMKNSSQLTVDSSQFRRREDPPLARNAKAGAPSSSVNVPDLGGGCDAGARCIVPLRVIGLEGFYG
jgi:hypothetical protein